MANKYDFRILIETENGKEFSYYSSSFINSEIDTNLIVSSSDIWNRITHSVSCSYQNSYRFDSTVSSPYKTTQKFSDNSFLSSSLSGSSATGSINFIYSGTKLGAVGMGGVATGKKDKLKQFKFFGTQVCHVLNLHENFWYRPEKFRFRPATADPMNPQSFIKADVEADSLAVTNNFEIGSLAGVTSDLPFKMDGTEYSRFIRFIQMSGSSGGTLPQNQLLIGYDNEKDSYIMSSSGDANFDLIGVNSLEVTHFTSSYQTSSVKQIFTEITSSGNSLFGDNALTDTHIIKGNTSIQAAGKGAADMNVNGLNVFGDVSSSRVFAGYYGGGGSLGSNTLWTTHIGLGRGYNETSINPGKISHYLNTDTNIQFDGGSDEIVATGSAFNMTGNIIASGDVSASNDISASKGMIDSVLYVGNHRAQNPQVYFQGQNSYITSPVDTATIGFHANDGNFQIMNTTNYQGVMEKGNINIKTYHYDNAFYIDNTDEIAYVNKDDKSLAVSSSGEVGIGKKPVGGMQLTVDGDISASGEGFFDDLLVADELEVGDNITLSSEGAGFGRGADEWGQMYFSDNLIQMGATALGEGGFRIDGHAESGLFFVTSSGTVGIGGGFDHGVPPPTTLTVKGDISASGDFVLGNLNSNTYVSASQGNIEMSGSGEGNIIVTGSITVTNTGSFSYITASHIDTDSDSISIGGEPVNKTLVTNLKRSFSSTSVRGNNARSVPTNIVENAMSSSGATIYHIHTFTDGDTTPSVKNGTLFKTANTSNTVIEGLADGVAGQHVMIIVNDANTDFSDETNFNMFRGGDWNTAAQNDTIQFICVDGTKWVQLGYRGDNT